MPWCPKCKTEYRDGITICADCKTELVAEYKDALLQDATALLVQVDVEHRMFTQKLHDFLEYSGIFSIVLNEGDTLGVYVAPNDFVKAKKCFKAFYSVETEMETQKAAESAFMKGEEFDYFGDDEEEEENSDSGALNPTALYNSFAVQQETEESKDEADDKYTSAASKYEDYHSSGVTFTVLGVLGVGFAMLNFIDVIDVFGNAFSCFALFVVFGIFLILGIFSFTKADQLKEAAESEKKLVADVKVWMEQNFTKDMFVFADMGEASDEEVNLEEILYMERLDQLVGQLLKVFPNLHDSLAEQLVEDFFHSSEE